jgi:hypothetical protein
VVCPCGQKNQLSKKYQIENRKCKEEWIMKVNLIIGIPAWLDKICSWPVTEFRKFKYGYSYRRIFLGDGKFTIVDLQDFYWLNKYRWVAYGKSDCPYAVRFACSSRGKVISFAMHREIMNPPPRLLVDHRNNNTLDNRRDNLRLATRRQNTCNRRKTKSKTSSRFIGVYFDKRSGKWAAKIKFMNKVIWLGRFNSEIDAAKTYDVAANKYHGEFARLNFSEGAPLS